MIRYQICKLVQWTNSTLRTRKRMQKVVYLLKVAGCPIEAEFRLHHFGPYSSDVAEETDAIVQLGLVVEQREGNLAGRQFNYSLPEQSARSLAEYESTEPGREHALRLDPYKDLAAELLSKDLRLLEIASTIAYFFEQNHDWKIAEAQACKFKSLQPSETLTAASQLARKVEQYGKSKDFSRPAVQLH